jgi:hypothetical protein
VTVGSKFPAGPRPSDHGTLIRHGRRSTDGDNPLKNSSAIARHRSAPAGTVGHGSSRTSATRVCRVGVNGSPSLPPSMKTLPIPGFGALPRRMAGIGPLEFLRFAAQCPKNALDSLHPSGIVSHVISESEAVSTASISLHTIAIRVASVRRARRRPTGVLGCPAEY